MGVDAGSFSALEPILDLLPAPLMLVEPGTARVAYANPAARPLAEARVAEELVRRLARGEPVEDVPLEWDTPAGRRSLVVSGDAMETPDGVRVGVLRFEDVTELEAARRRSDLLANAGPLLAASLDYDATLAEVGRLTVP